MKPSNYDFCVAAACLKASISIVSKGNGLPYASLSAKLHECMASLSMIYDYEYDEVELK